jgi:hypothetical protein
METIVLSVWWLIVVALVPALLVTVLLRAYYRGRLEDERYERHIDLEALKKQHHVDLEILHDRLSEENRAHLRTIQLLTRSRDQEQHGGTLALEEMLRLKEGEAQQPK